MGSSFYAAYSLFAIEFHIFKSLFTVILPSRFGSVVAHPDLDGEVSGSSLGHTKDF